MLSVQPSGLVSPGFLVQPWHLGGLSEICAVYNTIMT